MMEDVTAVIFEKDELDYRDMSELIALSTLLCSQDSNFDGNLKFHDI